MRSPHPERTNQIKAPFLSPAGDKKGGGMIGGKGTKAKKKNSNLRVQNKPHQKNLKLQIQ
jgi:hypothetical protein